MSEERKNSLKAEAARLPETPGVYQFLDREGTVIYVGKAKNLRRRVSSYFLERADHPVKVRVMVRQIAAMRHIRVETETDALLLENSLIKTLQPRYNILLKDDKTYPWIVVRNEPFPRVESTRRVVRDGSVYYGPYTSGVMQRNMLELVRALYPVRTCRLDLSPERIARGRYTVCLQYHLGNCRGPCAGLQSEADYDASISLVREMLRGHLASTRRWLEEQMHAAAAAMRYEAAAAWKNRLALLENYASRSVIVSPTLGDLDVFGIEIDDRTAYCNCVRTIAGSVVNSFTVELSLGAGDDDPASILTAALSQVSERLIGGLAREVVVAERPAEGLFPGIRFTVPSRGDKLKLLDFARQGARLYRMEKMKNLEIQQPQRHTEIVLEAMRKAFRLDRPPRHIECFDNSNLQGTHPVASCVVFRDGKPSRKEYRHFNIKTVVGPDDFASMREIIRRRYTRLVAEEAELPDLVVVDGGKGQLSAAYGVLQELGLAERIPIVGLAKRIEEIFFPGDPLPYYLDRRGEPLRVVMHLRDEAHRFGITFHRDKRSSDFIRSELRAIPGIGAKSAEELMRRLRTVSAVAAADEPTLAAIVGAARARRIWQYFHPAPDASDAPSS